MAILHVINLHRHRGGADDVARRSVEILQELGQEAQLITLDSRILGKGLRGKAHAFTSGIYSPMGRRVMAAAIKEHNASVVHIHDLFPFFSPWALLECRKARVPVVMTCHDYRQTCPTAQHYHKGEICERCIGGNEHWCVLKNCRGNILESTGYALRNIVARKFKLFEENVDLFLFPCEFLRQRFIAMGFTESRLKLIHYPITPKKSRFDARKGEYVAFVGRISPEKGIPLLLEAAKQTGIPVKIAGDYSEAIKLKNSAPENVEFLGWLEGDALDDFYRSARMLAFPSTWYETFGLVMGEAMSFGLPVVASDVGPRSEIVEDGTTGFLFENGNAEDLAKKMKSLWDDPGLCERFGAAGREKVEKNHKAATYGKELLGAYETAREFRENQSCR